MDHEKYRKEYLGEPDFNSTTIEDVTEHLKKNERFSEVTGSRLEDHNGKFDGWRITVRHNDWIGACLELKPGQIENMHNVQSSHDDFDMKNHIEQELLRLVEEERSKQRNKRKYYIK